MPEDGNYDRNMWLIFTKLIIIFVVDGITFVNFDVMYCNAVNSIICIPIRCSYFKLTFALSSVNIGMSVVSRNEDYFVF
jgi:hypothetical protein